MLSFQAAEKEKFADAVVIATLDNLHKKPCMAFAAKGYNILLEKPMATTLEDCEEIVKACKENGVILAVSHVLRYKPHFLKVKEIIDKGIIGELSVACFCPVCSGRHPESCPILFSINFSCLINS